MTTPFRTPHHHRGVSAGLGEVAAGVASGSACAAIHYRYRPGRIGLDRSGPAATGASIIAAFLAAVLAGTIVSALAGTRGLIGAPSSTWAIIVAGVLEVLVRRGVVPTGEAGIGPALAITMLLVLSTALLQAAVAALGVGRLVPLVPYPVLAGIRNGSAILLVIQAAQTASGGYPNGAMPLPGARSRLVVAAVTVAAMLCVDAPAWRPCRASSWH